VKGGKEESPTREARVPGSPRVKHVLGIDAGGTKTRALLADEAGRVLGGSRGGGANLRTHGELEVEKVLHAVVEQAEAEAGVRADGVALGIAGADRPEDHAVLREILRRIGFKDRVVVANDARIAFVAGSELRVGLALICGTGSIAWGRNAAGRIARAGGWGWHLGDEGSGFWIGEHAIRSVLRAADGRGRSTSLEQPLFEHFGISRPEEILRALYDAEYPRHRVALFAVRVEEAARAGDAVAGEILAAAASELVLAAETVVRRLDLTATPYDVVLSGGTFAALPGLEESVKTRLSHPNARILRLEEEPALGAVKLALEELGSLPASIKS
jgi:N-acetylglucosamine kinase-like BadF-type ATPase